MSRLIRWVAVSIALLVFEAASAQAQARPNDAVVEEGTRQLERGDFAGALAAFARAEKMAPRDPRPRYLRGAALAQRAARTASTVESIKDIDLAVRAYREALEIDPRLAEVHNELGALLADQKRFDEAAKEYRAAVAARPTLTEAWSNLGRLQNARGDFAGAVETFRQALTRIPDDVDLNVDLSIALRQVGRHGESEAAAREAARLAGKDPTVQLNLGLALQAAGKLEESASALRRAIELKPDLATAWWTLGTVELARKRPADAVDPLRRAYALNPKPSIAIDLASALIRSPDGVDAGVAQLEAAAAKHPRSLSLQLKLVETIATYRPARCDDARAILGHLPPDHEEVRKVAQIVEQKCPGRVLKKRPKER